MWTWVFVPRFIRIYCFAYAYDILLVPWKWIVWFCQRSVWHSTFVVICRTLTIDQTMCSVWANKRTRKYVRVCVRQHIEWCMVCNQCVWDYYLKICFWTIHQFDWAKSFHKILSHHRPHNGNILLKAYFSDVYRYR